MLFKVVQILSSPGQKVKILRGAPGSHRGEHAQRAGGMSGEAGRGGPKAGRDGHQLSIVRMEVVLMKSNISGSLDAFV